MGRQRNERRDGESMPRPSLLPEASFIMEECATQYEKAYRTYDRCLTGATTQRSDEARTR